MPEGRIVKAIAGFYYVEADDVIYECRARGRFRNTRETPLVGDFVTFQKEDNQKGYILKLKPRKNQLDRPPVCNIDQAFLVFSVKQPEFDQVLLDRFLAIIEHDQIKPVIVITKIDLDDSLIPYIQDVYHDYDVIFLSNKTRQGIDQIKSLFKDKVSVVTGQSGVGKSSLLNALDIHLNIATNEISEVLGRGKHTTRHTELIKMYGGYVADTPGFSSLDLTMEPEELANSYHDFAEKAPDCKFRNCLHDKEPSCAIKQAVADGTIAKSRYDHYLVMLAEVKEKKEKRYG